MANVMHSTVACRVVRNAASANRPPPYARSTPLTKAHNTIGLSITDSYCQICKFRRFFTAQCVARTMLSQDVCPSVRPSHAGVEMAKHIKLIKHRVATPFQASTPNVMAIFQRGPLTAVKCRWYEKM